MLHCPVLVLEAHLELASLNNLLIHKTVASRQHTADGGHDNVGMNYHICMRAEIIILLSLDSFPSVVNLLIIHFNPYKTFYNNLLEGIPMIHIFKKIFDN